jgi:REP element-mobilizing transposase RayT
MSYITVYVHYVWTTKNRIPYLNDSIRSQVIEHIKENAKKKDIYIDEINGYKDHIHCLVSMSQDKSLEEIAKLLKGESSFWINKKKLTSQKFGWQNEYWVAGVGKSDLNRVRKYIRNQEKHHKEVSFEEELEKFLEEFGLKPV